MKAILEHVAQNLDAEAEAVDDLQALSGVNANDTHLGTFNGSSIDNGATIKSALQSVDTEIDALRRDFRGAMMTLSSPSDPAVAGQTVTFRLKHVAEGMTFEWKTPNSRTPSMEAWVSGVRSFTLSNVTVNDSGDYQAIAKINDIVIGRSTVLNFQIAASTTSLQEYPSSFNFSGIGFGDNIAVTISNGAHDNGTTYSIETSNEQYDFNKLGAFTGTSYWRPNSNRYQTSGGHEGLGTLMQQPTKRGSKAAGTATALYTRGDYLVLHSSTPFVLRKLMVETVETELAASPNTLLVFGCRDSDSAFTLITSITRHDSNLGMFIDNSTAYNSYLVQFMAMMEPNDVRISRLRFFGTAQ